MTIIALFLLSILSFAFASIGNYGYGYNHNQIVNYPYLRPVNPYYPSPVYKSPYGYQRVQQYGPGYGYSYDVYHTSQIKPPVYRMGPPAVFVRQNTGFRPVYIDKIPVIHKVKVINNVKPPVYEDDTMVKGPKKDMDVDIGIDVEQKNKEIPQIHEMEPKDVLPVDVPIKDAKDDDDKNKGIDVDIKDNVKDDGVKEDGDKDKDEIDDKDVDDAFKNNYVEKSIKPESETVSKVTEKSKK